VRTIVRVAIFIAVTLLLLQMLGLVLPLPWSGTHVLGRPYFNPDGSVQHLYPLWWPRLGTFEILFLLVVLAIVYRHLGRSEKAGTQSDTSAEETRIMQEIHAGLARLEDRVESLETLLIDGRHGRAAR